MSTEWRTRYASVIEGVCVPRPRKRTHSRFARNSPVGWKERGYELDYIVEQALRRRVSTVNIKSRQIPNGGKGPGNAFQKKSTTLA
ncbi:MAG TPA: hypothetical protein VF749_17905 [Candidatus Acidoferrum sp.]